MGTLHIGREADTRGRRAAVHPFAGVGAGLIAGSIYLVLQVLFAGFLDSPDPWLPLERIAAMLLGDDAVSDAHFTMNMAGIGLLVHVAVSIVYGRIVDIVVRDAPPLQATLSGAAVGAAMYLVAFHFVAPHVFPWFSGSPQLITLLNHVAFGAVAGFAYYRLRRRWSPVAPSVADSSTRK